MFAKLNKKLNGKTVNTINILTQQIDWKNQFSKIDRHRFVYNDFNCTPLQLIALCKNENIDIILCMDYEIQTKFSEYYASHTALLGIPWLLPTPQASEMENKFKFYRWMEERNLTQYIPASRNLKQFPYILKIGNGYSAKYVYLVKNEHDLNNLNFENYICQEYVPGKEEYVHHFIAVGGICIWQKTYKHVFAELVKEGDLYLKGKGFFNKKIQTIELENNHKEVIESIILKLGFTGAGCFDFKIYKNRLFLFELNSRMGGSLLYFDEELHDLDDFLSIYLTSLPP